MAPLAEDEEAALGSTFTTDDRVGALHALGEGMAADG